MTDPGAQAAPPAKSSGMSRIRTLRNLAPGESGFVLDVDLSNALGRRLVELGITPGVLARVIRRAPLGDPIEISLSESHLSLRSYEAALVRITDNT